jgi:hypothetical protein
MMVGQNNSHYGQRGRVMDFVIIACYCCHHRYLLLHSSGEREGEWWKKTARAIHCSLFIIVAEKHNFLWMTEGIAIEIE